MDKVQKPSDSELFPPSTHTHTHTHTQVTCLVLWYRDQNYGDGDINYGTYINQNCILAQVNLF
jgi:hypothetical protein